MTTPAAPPVPELDPHHLAVLKAGLLSEFGTQTEVTPFRRRRPRLLISAAAAAAITAGAYVAVTSLGHGGAVAYAWSPTPTATTPAEVKRAISVCRNADAWTAPGNSPGASAFVHAAPAVVTERRLKTFSIILSDGHRYATCILPDPSRPEPLASTGGFTGPDRGENISRPTGHGVQLLSGSSESGDGNGHDDHLVRTFISGRSGPDVRSIVIPLKDGRTVTATVSKTGWWEAWYPDKLGPNVTQLGNATVTSADGTKHLEALRF